MAFLFFVGVLEQLAEKLDGVPSGQAEAETKKDDRSAMAVILRDGALKRFRLQPKFFTSSASSFGTINEFGRCRKAD